ANDALFPLRGEIAGGTTAMISFGPVNDILATLDQYLDRRYRPPLEPSPRPSSCADNVQRRDK
ncbi:hypothetical protein ACWDAZ_39430, partial [Streptomyces sp. NPDC001215]